MLDPWKYGPPKILKNILELTKLWPSGQSMEIMEVYNAQIVG